MIGTVQKNHLVMEVTERGSKAFSKEAQSKCNIVESENLYLYVVLTCFY